MGMRRISLRSIWEERKWNRRGCIVEFVGFRDYLRGCWMCVGVEPEGVDPESHWLSIQLSFRPHFRKNHFLSVFVAVSFVPPHPSTHSDQRERVISWSRCCLVCINEPTCLQGNMKADNSDPCRLSYLYLHMVMVCLCSVLRTNFNTRLCGRSSQGCTFKSNTQTVYGRLKIPKEKVVRQWNKVRLHLVYSFQWFIEHFGHISRVPIQV